MKIDMSKLFKMKKCPICKKEFIYNGRSIYKIRTSKINGQYKIKWYCGYTCWRKAGGDKNEIDEDIQRELRGEVYIK